MWRATKQTTARCSVCGISIHTLRVEGDLRPHVIKASSGRISIHTLRVEGDQRMLLRQQQRHQFQSTPSVWRATIFDLWIDSEAEISIHTLRVEGDSLKLKCDYWVADISIHTLRVEGDLHILEYCTVKIQNFNPHPPCGGRRCSSCMLWHVGYFNPHPPCGGRLLLS